MAAPLAACEHRPPEAGKSVGKGRRWKGEADASSSLFPLLLSASAEAAHTEVQLTALSGTWSRVCPTQPQLPPFGSAPPLGPTLTLSLVAVGHWAQGSRIQQDPCGYGLSPKEARAGDTSTQKPVPRHLQQLLTFNCSNCPARKQPSAFQQVDG